jgi:hypothetical protein
MDKVREVFCSGGGGGRGWRAKQAGNKNRESAAPYNSP